MRRLSEVAQGRDNNFSLIRLAAAVAVLVSHAVPLTQGRGAPEPLERWMGHSLGTLAVYVFFVASGFFVAGSLERRGVGGFVRARARRILPGLAVSLLLVTFVLGPLVTSLTLQAYLAAPGTAAFLVRGLLPLHPLYTLPGVFLDNPYPKVAGSIWTLAYEIVCYAALALAALVPRGRGWAARAMLAAFALAWLVAAAAGPALPEKLARLQDLSLPFVLGVLAWHLRARIVLSGSLALGLAGLAVAAAGGPAGFPALILALGYATLWAGYTPCAAGRAWNRLGDYSYGVYIYAFPVQGLAVWWLGPHDPALNVALALPATLVCAVLSWHLVERPALHTRRSPASDAPRTLRGP